MAGLVRLSSPRTGGTAAPVRLPAWLFGLAEDFDAARKITTSTAINTPMVHNAMKTMARKAQAGGKPVVMSAP